MVSDGEWRRIADRVIDSYVYLWDPYSTVAEDDVITATPSKR
jgi:hypothetical protein